jgi:hypothetical protein
MLVMAVYTRRIIGFGVEPASIDGVSVCRMFNHATAGQPRPKHLSTNHDPLFRFHRLRSITMVGGSIVAIYFRPRSGRACEFATHRTSKMAIGETAADNALIPRYPDGLPPRFPTIRAASV